MRQSFGLTPRQRELLAFIKARIRVHGVPPTVREMQAGIGASSPSNVHGLLVCLERRGAIERMPGRARAIRLREAA